MGEVLEAEEVCSGRKVAIKIILMPDATRRLRFQREMLVNMKLTSPYVVRCFGSGETDDGQLYLVLEWMDAPTAAVWLEQSGPMPIEDLAEILRQLGDVGAEMNQHGIVHRDFKLANLFIERRVNGLHVRACDFGIAKLPVQRGDVPDKLTEEGQSPGTPDYASPEQIRGKALDQRADVWAIGVCVYQLATGHLPFEGALAGERMSRILAGDFTPACDHRPELPAAFDAWLARVFSVDPEKRFRSILDAAEAFRATVVRRPSIRVPAPAEFAPTELMSPDRPRSLQAPLFSVAAVVIVAAVLWRARPAATQEAVDTAASASAPVVTASATATAATAPAAPPAAASSPAPAEPAPPPKRDTRSLPGDRKPSNDGTKPGRRAAPGSAAGAPILLAAAPVLTATPPAVTLSATPPAAPPPESENKYGLKPR
jgi:serine/threonine protein kinase